MRPVAPMLLRKALGDVRDSIRALDRTLTRLVVANGAQRAKGTPERRTRRLSEKTRSALVLQGRYMGYMRQLKPRQKVQVKKVKEVKGVRAAIGKARLMLAK